MPDSRSGSPLPLELLSSVKRIETSLKDQNYSRKAVQHELRRLRETTAEMEQLLLRSVAHVMQRNSLSTRLEEIRIDIEDATAKLLSVKEKEKELSAAGTPTAMSEYLTKHAGTQRQLSADPQVPSGEEASLEAFEGDGRQWKQARDKVWEDDRWHGGAPDSQALDLVAQCLPYRLIVNCMN